MDKQTNKTMTNIEVIKKKYNGNNILHFLCIRGKDKKINKILKQFPKLFYVSNDNGETCAHLLINNGWFDIFKKYYLIYPDILNYVDNNNNNILQITKNEKLIKWIIDNTKKDYYNCFNNINLNNNTLCLDLIFNNNVEIFKKIIDVIDLNIPKQIPPLMYASELNKVDMVELILDHNINLINMRDLDENNSLMRSTYNKAIDVTKVLLDKGCDIYYGGLENNYCPINICIKNKDIDHLELFLKYYKNLNFVDKYLNTPLHNILYSFINQDKWCSLDVLYILLSLGNINKKNLENISPLDLLKELKIDNCFTLLISSDVEHKYFMIDDKFSDLINEKSPNTLVSDTKIDYKTNNLSENSTNEDLSDSETLSKDSGTTNKSIESDSSRTDNKLSENLIELSIEKVIRLPKIEHAYFSLFNPNILHNYIYTIILLKKHKNLFVTHQNRNNYEDDLKILNYKFYKTSDEKDLWDLYKTHFSFYELLPHLIIWKNNDLHYINKNFVECIKKINFKTRFIYFKLTLIVNEGKHSNILIYDKLKKELIRFEPYGDIEISDDDVLNEKLKELFKQVDEDSKIIIPKNYLYDTGFQNISNDSLNIKVGDPGGFCLAWSLWFLELKLNNPDENNHILVKNAFDNIKTDYNKNYIGNISVDIVHNNPFLNYIRDYANNLDDEKNKYLLSKGIKNDEIYNNYFPKDKRKKIINFILEDFDKIKNN